LLCGNVKYISLYFSFCNSESATYCRCERFQNISSCFDILLEKYYAEDTIFIGQSDFEDVRLIFDLFAADSQTCQSFFRTVLCFYEFPPCNITAANISELLPICLSRCPEIQSAFQFCFGRLDLTFIDSVRYPSLLGVIEHFNCSLSETYYVNDAKTLVISNSRCSELLCKCNNIINFVH